MYWPFSRRVLSRQELGALGERHAARALRSRGLRVLEANFRTKYGELDLVARDGDTLVYVEVRTRTRQDDFRTPLESVDAEKQRRLIRLARAYRAARRIPDCPGRYDVVEVIATPQGRILDLRHIEGAFIEGM